MPHWENMVFTESMVADLGKPSCEARAINDLKTKRALKHTQKITYNVNNAVIRVLLRPDGLFPTDARVIR